MTATTHADQVIAAREVWKRYDSADVLKGISLGVQHGDVKVILGPSTCSRTSRRWATS